MAITAFLKCNNWKKTHYITKPPPSQLFCLMGAPLCSSILEFFVSIQLSTPKMFWITNAQNPFLLSYILRKQIGKRKTQKILTFMSFDLHVVKLYSTDRWKIQCVFHEKNNLELRAEFTILWNREVVFRRCGGGVLTTINIIMDAIFGRQSFFAYLLKWFSLV